MLVLSFSKLFFFFSKCIYILTIQEIKKKIDWLVDDVIGSEDMCLTMDQSDRSYQLLGGYAAGESIYTLETLVDFNNGMSEASVILFSPSSSSSEPTRVKLPTLEVTNKHLLPFTGDESL